MSVCAARAPRLYFATVYDDCPDHRLPGISVCASCVRPLCRKCKVTRSRCAECRAAVAKENSQEHVPGKAAAGTGGLMLVVGLLCLVMVLLNWKGCPGMPKDIIWLK